MPQNTPMKRQFTTIDGRTVMSNLPQHWGGNDWTITGVDNPLPVGNYVQTEAGVWIPQKGSDDGAADVRLTGSNIEQIIFSGIELEPGETSTRVYAPEYARDFSKFTIITRTEENSPYTVDVLWDITNQGEYARFRTLDKIEIDRSSFISDVIYVKTSRPSFRLTNNDSEPRVFDMHVFWIK